ncbi:hypothetical protein GLOTRDRAFT_109345 [Gloeophyllum trabeum ATCC 11539]|uniref:Uncharacterized protein n=1 Tax=Gloeophyllum trabeum (strain ATCC 11539 / FP-39264 / Madison 617) TaxID=670483 RepID=S7S5D9_GLOTA|nr:uncharacterized protein GLOTRDRAFT_109345 [Gloeophyllum trabeum ATCC 11539]EPQ61184.1 hypothetical protein GLOTRDRAFT_109345 [Gloeophyllum trabeum ATCC 11539]
MDQGLHKYYVSPNLQGDPIIHPELQEHLNAMSKLYIRARQMEKMGMHDRLAEQRRKAEESRLLKEQAEREREKVGSALEASQRQNEMLAARLRELDPEFMNAMN